MKLPPLRSIEIVPIEHEGQPCFYLYDPRSIVDEQMLLSSAAVFVASMLDGHNGVEDIQLAFRDQTGGVILEHGQILEIVEHLDQIGFLQTEHFDAIHARVSKGFSEADTRPAFLAGKSYPEEAGKLRAFLDEQFLRDGGPGEGPHAEPEVKDSLPGLIVPHIDFERGGHAYAHGYRSLSRHAKPDTVIVFGVAHASEPVPFILSRKHFDTPLGVVKVDLEMVGRLEQACTWDPFAFELTHRTEHSIEFQAVMLSYLYGSDVQIVPILCSMFGEDFYTGAPAATEPIEEFLRACNQCVQDADKMVSVIASADLAHVGRKFGDPFDIDQGVLDSVARRDKEDLRHTETVDAVSFYASVMMDGNRRRVCGLNCIYSALRSVDGIAKVGEALHYDYAEDPAGGIVSFASVALRA